MELGSNETIKQAVMAGIGIALISAHTVAAEVDDGRLVRLDVEELPIVGTWYVINRTDRDAVAGRARLSRFRRRRGIEILAAGARARSGSLKQTAIRSNRTL